MSRTIRILVVDDEALVLSSLRRLLAREPEFTVSVCEGGAAGLAFLEKEPIDVVVSDYKMPGMDGISFLKRVQERWPRVLRILLTAQADKEQVTAGLSNGLLHRHVPKPWDNQTLVELLRSSASAPKSAVPNPD